MKRIHTLEELVGVVDKLKNNDKFGYWIFPINKEILHLKEHNIKHNVWTTLPNQESIKIVEVKRGYLLVAYSKEDPSLSYEI